MKRQTLAIHTRFQSKDAYNAISMPVYHTAAYEFDNAADMADAFCGRTSAPDYSRVTNLFDNKTLAIHPASTIFGPFTDSQRESMDVLDTTIRLSIGLEDVDDLLEDIRQALG